MLAPLWFRLARGVVRRLPAGRFRAFDLLATLPRTPFEDRLAADAGGYRYACDLRHMIAREICLTGRYSPTESAVVKACLAPGDTFVDVGANFGYFTLLGAAAVGPHGRVIALEPDPRMTAELRSNVALNALDHVTVVAAAASDHDGTARLNGFADHEGNRGISALARDTAADPRAPTFEVACGRLDQLLTVHDVADVALVKIDVEGAETLVLRGMREGIAGRRYQRVLVEFHPWLHDDFAASLRVIDREFSAAGYHGWLVDETAARRTYYGAPAPLRLTPLAVSNPGIWPHVLWTLEPTAPA